MSFFFLVAGYWLLVLLCTAAIVIKTAIHYREKQAIFFLAC